MYKVAKGHKGFLKHNEEFINGRLIVIGETLEDIARDACLNFFDELKKYKDYPFYTGNLHDSMKVAMLVGDRIELQHNYTSEASKKQHWGEEGEIVSGYGRNYLSKVNVNALRRDDNKVHKNDITVLIGAGIPYASGLNDGKGINGAAWEGWFTKIALDFHAYVSASMNRNFDKYLHKNGRSVRWYEQYQQED